MNAKNSHQGKEQVQASCREQDASKPLQDMSSANDLLPAIAFLGVGLMLLKDYGGIGMFLLFLFLT